MKARMRAQVLVSGVVCCLLLPAATAWATSSFQSLGFLDAANPYSIATGVSGDGSLIVGQSTAADGRTESFVYRMSGGMQSIGWPDDLSAAADLDYSTNHVRAYGISDDGSTIVGQHKVAYPDLFSYPHSAFRYDVDTGNWSTRPCGDSGCRFYAASADGSRAVGESNFDDPGLFAFVDPIGGLPLYLGFDTSSAHTARDISADGSIIVGTFDPFDAAMAYRFDEAVGGAELLFAGDAYGISSDGSTIVGQAASVYEAGGWTALEAVRWTAAEGMVRLGILPGNSQSQALAVSGDGGLVVGYSRSGASRTAFLWDETHGMRSLIDILELDGVDMTGWQLREATAVSADGTRLVGVAINPEGATEAFLMTIPEPGTGLLLASGLVGLATRRRAVRRRKTRPKRRCARGDR